MATEFVFGATPPPGLALRHGPLTVRVFDVGQNVAALVVEGEGAERTRVTLNGSPAHPHRGLHYFIPLDTIEVEHDGVVAVSTQGGATRRLCGAATLPPPPIAAHRRASAVL